MVKRWCSKKTLRFYFLWLRGFPRGQGLRAGALRSENAVRILKPTKQCGHGSVRLRFVYGTARRAVPVFGSDSSSTKRAYLYFSRVLQQKAWFRFQFRFLKNGSSGSGSSSVPGKTRARKIIGVFWKRGLLRKVLSLEILENSGILEILLTHCNTKLGKKPLWMKVVHPWKLFILRPKAHQVVKHG